MVEHAAGVQFAGFVVSDRNSQTIQRGPGFLAVFNIGGEHHSGIAIAQLGGAFRRAGQLGQIGKPFLKRAQIAIKIMIMFIMLCLLAKV